jgi:hypothetical protein
MNRSTYFGLLFCIGSYTDVVVLASPAPERRVPCFVTNVFRWGRGFSGVFPKGAFVVCRPSEPGQSMMGRRGCRAVCFSFRMSQDTRGPKQTTSALPCPNFLPAACRFEWCVYICLLSMSACTWWQFCRLVHRIHWECVRGMNSCT